MELERNHIETRRKFIKKESELEPLKTRQLERDNDVIVKQKRLSFLKMDMLDAEYEELAGKQRITRRERSPPPPLPQFQDYQFQPPMQQQQQQHYSPMRDYRPIVIPLTSYHNDGNSRTTDYRFPPQQQQQSPPRNRRNNNGRRGGNRRGGGRGGGGGGRDEYHRERMSTYS